LIGSPFVSTWEVVPDIPWPLKAPVGIGAASPDTLFLMKVAFTLKSIEKSCSATIAAFSENSNPLFSTLPARFFQVTTEPGAYILL